MKKRMIYYLAWAACMPICSVESQQSMAKTRSTDASSAVPQGILIFNINDNTSRSTDALLHVVQSMIAQKNNLDTTPSMHRPRESALLENQQTTDTGLLSVTQLGVGASCLAAFCTWLKIKLLADKSFHYSYWSVWRSDIPLHVFVELSDHDIITELWQALRECYAPDIAVCDINVLEIIRLFLSDIEQERRYLEDLLWWYHTLRVMHVYRFFGDPETEYRTEKQCQRLELLKNCVCIWANACLCKDGVAFNIENLI